MIEGRRKSLILATVTDHHNVFVASKKGNPAVRGLGVDADALRRWQARGLIPAPSGASPHAWRRQFGGDPLDRLPPLVQGGDVEPVGRAAPVD